MTSLSDVIINFDNLVQSKDVPVTRDDLSETQRDECVEISAQHSGTTARGNTSSCSSGDVGQGAGSESKFLEESIERSDARRIRQALSPATVKALSPILRGISHDRKYQVTSTENDEYFVKIFETRADGSNASGTRSEIEWTVWAAEKGFGPQIAVSDVKQGILITQYLTNEMGRWEDGKLEPRLSASLAHTRPSLKRGVGACLPLPCCRRDGKVEAGVRQIILAARADAFFTIREKGYQGEYRPTFDDPL